MTNPRIEAAVSEWICQINSLYIEKTGGPAKWTDPEITSNIRNAMAASIAAADAAAWRPIESAPKDGATVLLTDGSEVSQGWYEDRSFVRHDVAQGGDFYCAYYDSWKPTHWQPIPKPPETP